MTKKMTAIPKSSITAMRRRIWGIHLFHGYEIPHRTADGAVRIPDQHGHGRDLLPRGVSAPPHAPVLVGVALDGLQCLHKVRLFIRQRTEARGTDQHIAASVQYLQLHFLPFLVLEMLHLFPGAALKIEGILLDFGTQPIGQASCPGVQARFHPLVII